MSFWQKLLNLLRWLRLLHTPKPPPPATFAKGMCLIPAQPVTTGNWYRCGELFNESHTEWMLHHLKVGNKDTGFIAGMADKYKLKVLWMVDPLKSNRKELVGGKTFKDHDTRKAFIDYCVWLADMYHPEYMGFSSEINTYLDHHPSIETDYYVMALKEAIIKVKRISPKTQCLASFQWEKFHSAIFRKLEPLIDVVGITTYPSTNFYSPANIPADYYSSIKRHTSKPIIIAESGWPSGGKPEWHGNEANQAAFVKRLRELLKGLPVDIVVWWFQHDVQFGYHEYFWSCGLRKSTGEPKQSWKFWKEM